ncbi:MAG: GAF domain-containing protein [Chloroflexi bacterium]|nr:GAF domain-containing protein [Chloroflexota bacterium]
MAKNNHSTSKAGGKNTGRQGPGGRKPRADAETKRQQKIQTALFEIADAASAVTDMQSFYKRLHEIVGTLMYAENFIIFLYDAATNIRSVPYVADSMGDLPPPSGPVPPGSLLAEVLAHPHTLHYKKKQNEAAVRVGQMYGTPAEDFVGIPLVVDSQAIGGIIVQSYIKGIGYSEEDIRLLEFVAQHIAIALTRARAIEETRQRNSELQIINSVQEGLASKLDMQGIYDLVGDKLREIFDAQAIQLVSFDHEKNLMRRNYLIENGQRLHVDPLPISKVWAYFIGNPRTTLLNNVKDFIAQVDPDFVAPPVGHTPRSLIAVPLMVNGELRGAIDIESLDRENAFSESDVRLLETLANSMSVALENARLFDETQRLLKETEDRADELSIINVVQQGLASKLDMQAIYDLVGDKVRDIFNSEVIYIAIRGIDDRDRIRFPYALDHGERFQMRDLKFGEGLTSKILVSNQPVVANTLEEQIELGSVLEPDDEQQSYMGVPICLGDTAIGVVAVQSYERFAFNDSDVRLLGTLAASMGVALENVRLFTETQQRNAELAILNSVGEAMAKTLDVKTVTRIVGDKVRDIFSADQIGILLLERQTNLLHLLYGYDKAHDRYLDDGQVKPIPLGKGLTSKVIESRQPLLFGTQEEKKGYGHYMPPELVGQIKLCESWLGVPIMVADNVLGAVLVEDYRPYAYNESHLRLLQTLSSNMGVAIQNARLFDEIQQRNAELAIINSVQEGLASKLDMQEIYELVGDKIREIFNAQSVMIGTYDPDAALTHVNYLFVNGERQHPEDSPLSRFAQYFINTQETVVINTNAEQRVEELGMFVRNNAQIPRSMLYVPMVVSSQVRGFISLRNMEQENAFGESHVRLLETLANSMSVALENARLWEQERMFRKALQRELEIGREIQAGFLPDELPLVEGWEIAASLLSAREVAGDFYDVFELPDGNIGLVIADVCDKGVGAALFMTLFRSLIRATANLDYFEHTGQADAPHSVEERLQRAMSLTNNYIAETHQKSSMFATLFFGILDPRSGKLAYINGGHEPPLIVRAGNVREALRNTGPASGVIPNWSFEIRETQLDAGDVFFAFTDGVPDSRNPDGEFFGHERLFDFLQRNDKPPQELVKVFERGLQEYIAGATQFDDITLLAVRRERHAFRGREGLGG